MTTKNAAEAKAPRHRSDGYDEKYCKQIIDLGKQGCTIQEMAEYFDISVDTLYRWAKEYEEFGHAKDKALDYQIGYLVRVGRQSLNNREFNSRTHEIILNNAYYQSNLRSLKKLIRSTDDPVKQCMHVLEAVLDGSITQARAEQINSMIMSVYKADKVLEKMIGDVLAKQMK